MFVSSSRCRIILFFLCLVLPVQADESPAACYRTITARKQDAYRMFVESPGLPDGVAIQEPEADLYPRAGTVSHHLAVAGILDRWFVSLKKLRGVDTFIILSPDHFQRGMGYLSFSSLPWEGGNGSVSVHRGYLSRLLSQLEAVEDRDAMIGEHGVGVFIPFIKKYFPDARIVPIMADESRINLTRVSRLSEAVGEILQADPGVFLLVSIDFSHRAGKAVTAERDRYSKLFLESLERKYLFKAYADNYSGLFLLASLFEQLGGGGCRIFCHSDDSFMYDGESDNLTSYFFSFFY